ncbi:MAG: Gfo/Idh/MocA family protein [Flavonifractor plautii]
MINIGIVGAGGMGTVHHSNYRHLDGCAVVGVVDPSPAGRERAAQWGVPCYESITDLVDAGGVDVVDICTPTFLHRDNVMESLSLGKTTIVEKPCALTRADAEAMFALAEEKGVNLYVAQVLQFTREVEVLRKLVREGTYGRPLDAVFQRLSARPEWAQGGWLFDKSKSGLVPFDLHIHDLDVIVSLFGVPDQAECRPCGGPAMDSPELYRWEYRCGGVNVMAEAGWLNASVPFTAVWRVYFENAMVIYDGKCRLPPRLGAGGLRHGGGRQNPHRHQRPPHRLVLRRARALPVLHPGGKALPPGAPGAHPGGAGSAGDRPGGGRIELKNAPRAAGARGAFYLFFIRVCSGLSRSRPSVPGDRFPWWI